MARAFIITAFVVLCALSPSNGLKCHEGFNMTLNGMPLYFWNERNCTGDSKCIGQEFVIDTALTGTPLRTAVRYGACMSSAYADHLDCDKLFGEESTFDPANLLDIIPGIGESITSGVEIFSQNVSASLKELLSDGTGMEAFVDGVFTFYENIGLNLTKAAPLKPSLVKLLTALFDSSQDANATAVFFYEFSQLDTENPEFAASLRSILTNVGVNLNVVQTHAPFVITLMERGPGLVRSVFPSNWQVALWYDVAFKLVGNINPANWTKSTEDVVATIKSSYQIPNDIAQYVNPILDALPDLARGLQINPAYTGNWSLELLKEFSEEDNATQAFSTALTNFLETIIRMPLQYEFKATIKWMPGLFYKFSPGDKAVIQEVYMKMTDGFNSFDFSNIGSTASETKLSMMIKNLVTAFVGPQVFNTSTADGVFSNALVVNFAKMFYDLMNVTVDYTGYIDKFAMVIDEEFKNPSMINVGSMIGKLITGFGGQIPAELAPMLENIQSILTAAMEQPLSGTKLLEAFSKLTASYKSQYPDSPFPDLVDRYIVLMLQLLTIDYTDPEAGMAKANELNLELQYWNIDLQFAIVKSQNYSSDELYQMLVAAWPEYDLYIRVLQAMDPDDVKQLLKDIIAYLLKSPPHTTQDFVDATKPTFQKITKSIETLMGEIRRLFSPNSCQFASCMTELCNDQQTISSAVVRTPTNWHAATDAMPTEVATDAMTMSTTMTTTSDSDKVTFNVLLNIATLWIAAKLFY